MSQRGAQCHPAAEHLGQQVLEVAERRRLVAGGGRIRFVEDDAHIAGPGNDEHLTVLFFAHAERQVVGIGEFHVGGQAEGGGWCSGENYADRAADGAAAAVAADRGSRPGADAGHR
ncbi:hypothetical protein [Streptomyces sp. NPDC018045]|uniref:hypothetical protein n=1 Tax=Streptomyces sp. NPDC018045 TaxID=3365037 RepID=UPI003792AAE4